MSYAEKLGIDTDMSDEQIMQMISSEKENTRSEDVEVKKPHINYENTEENED